ELGFADVAEGAPRACYARAIQTRPPSDLCRDASGHVWLGDRPERGLVLAAHSGWDLFHLQRAARRDAHGRAVSRGLSCLQAAHENADTVRGLMGAAPDQWLD